MAMASPGTCQSCIARSMYESRPAVGAGWCAGRCAGCCAASGAVALARIATAVRRARRGMGVLVGAGQRGGVRRCIQNVLMMPYTSDAGKSRCPPGARRPDRAAIFRHPPPLARCPGHHDEKVWHRAWGAFDHAAAGTACRRSLTLFPGAANGDLVHCLPLHHGHVVRSLRNRGHQGAERRGWPHRPQCGHRVRPIFDCARSRSAGGTGSRQPRDRAGRVSGKRRSAAHIPPEGAARRFAHGVTCRLRALALAAGVIVASPCGRAAAQQPRPVPATPDTARTDSSTMPGMRMPMSGDTTKPMPGMRAGGHDMSHGMNGPLGLSHVRMGSGTSWMPDSSPMHAAHRTWDGWTVMLHGVAFGQYDDQGSMRGDHQLGIVDWEMLMAMRRIGAGQLHLHAMVSLEPLTLGAKGYPLLLQTGESYRGQP